MVYEPFLIDRDVYEELVLSDEQRKKEHKLMTDDPYTLKEIIMQGEPWFRHEFPDLFIRNYYHEVAELFQKNLNNQEILENKKLLIGVTPSLKRTLIEYYFQQCLSRGKDRFYTLDKIDRVQIGIDFTNFSIHTIEVIGEEGGKQFISRANHIVSLNSYTSLMLPTSSDVNILSEFQRGYTLMMNGKLPLFLCSLCSRTDEVLLRVLSVKYIYLDGLNNFSIHFMADIPQRDIKDSIEQYYKEDEIGEYVLEKESVHGQFGTVYRIAMGINY